MIKIGNYFIIEENALWIVEEEIANPDYLEIEGFQTYKPTEDSVPTIKQIKVKYDNGEELIIKKYDPEDLKKIKGLTHGLW